MGLLSKWFTGIDTDEEQRRNEQLNAQLTTMQENALQSGRITPEEYAIYQEHAQTGATGDVNLQVREAFAEGAAEGFQNVLTAPGKAVGAVGGVASTLFGGVLKNVPWWAYLAAAVALFVWMGGLALLRGRLAR